MQPYVQELLSIMQERKEQDALVSQKGSKAINWEGITVKEILLQLRGGVRTREGVARALQLDTKLVRNYFFGLRDKGMIKISQAERGGMVAQLVD